MACKDKSKEQKEKAKKACATKKTHVWNSDSCSCDKKLIPDVEFKKDSTRKDASSHAYMEFLRRFKGK